MTKYYIGLGVIGLITLGLVIYTIVLGSSGKQDANTEKRANEIASKLNSYISKNRKIPASLSEAGVNDAPSTITYTKNSDGTTYKFCVTYKSATSYGSDPTELLWGGALQGASQEDNSYSSYSSDYQPATLYLSYYHKKGENCQTIKPYINNYNYNSLNTYNSIPSTYGKTPANTKVDTTKDTERKADLKAIASQLETYYAKNDYYPTTANMISQTWITLNLKGLDKEALRDPDSTHYELTTEPLFGKDYGYAPKASDGYGCASIQYPCKSFTLYAYLSDGTLYTVKSLN